MKTIPPYSSFRNLAGLSFLALFLSACSKKSNDFTTLILANEAEPATLDLHLATGQSEIRILGALYEGLLVRSSESRGWSPGIAHTWDIDTTKTRYTFHLSHWKWSDGVPLVASDFVYSWKRLIAPSTGAEYGSLLLPLVNGSLIREGKLPLDSLGVFAPNDSTLEVHLQAPLPYFLDLCAFEPLAPVPRHIIERDSTLWGEAGHQVSSGPYILGEHHRNVDLVLHPNPMHPNSGKIQNLVFKSLDDQMTAYTMYLAGEVDWLFRIPPPKLETAKHLPGFFKGPMFGTYYLLVNTKKPGFDSKLLRQALAYSIDREAIVTSVLKGLNQPATGFVPPTEMFPGVPHQLYDPERARKLLALSGFSAQNPPPKLEFLFNTSETHKMLAEVITQMWKSNLGLNAELVNFEWKVYLERTKNGEFNSIARASWVGDYPDPITFLELAETGNGNNRSGFSNPTYDSLVRLSRYETNKERRKELMNAAEALLLEEMPVIPIYYYALNELRSPRVGNAKPNPLGMYPWREVSIAKP